MRLTKSFQMLNRNTRNLTVNVWQWCGPMNLFHQHIYGRPLTVVTDHEPLVSIFNNPKSKPPLRLQRYALRLEAYQVKVTYMPRTSNSTDDILCPVRVGSSHEILTTQIDLVDSTLYPKQCVWKKSNAPHSKVRLCKR